MLTVLTRTDASESILSFRDRTMSLGLKIPGIGIDLSSKIGFGGIEYWEKPGA